MKRVKSPYKSGNVPNKYGNAHTCEEERQEVATDSEIRQSDRNAVLTKNNLSEFSKANVS